MGLVNRNVSYSSFYCCICGNKAMEIPRKQCSQREKFHLKKLYCCTCRRTINCIECRNQEEIDTFKKAFAAGEYKELAAAELEGTYVPSGLME